MIQQGKTRMENKEFIQCFSPITKDPKAQKILTQKLKEFRSMSSEDKIRHVERKFGVKLNARH